MSITTQTHRDRFHGNCREWGSTNLQNRALWPELYLFNLSEVCAGGSLVSSRCNLLHPKAPALWEMNWLIHSTNIYWVPACDEFTAAQNTALGKWIQTRFPIRITVKSHRWACPRGLFPLPLHPSNMYLGPVCLWAVLGTMPRGKAS